MKDITPPYSPNYPGGYGGVNIEADRIVWSILTLQFANGEVFELGTGYNQTKDVWSIDAADLPLGGSENKVPCSTCGQGGHLIQYSENGRRSAFPTGCILAKYEVFSADLSAPTGKKLEGTKVTRFISKCIQTNKLLELIDKMTLPGADGRFPGANSEQERHTMLQQWNMAWTKLELLEADGCDCDCVAASIKQADQYLSSFNL